MLSHSCEFFLRDSAKTPDKEEVKSASWKAKEARRDLFDFSSSPPQPKPVSDPLLHTKEAKTSVSPDAEVYKGRRRYARVTESSHTRTCISPLHSSVPSDEQEELNSVEDAPYRSPPTPGERSFSEFLDGRTSPVSPTPIRNTGRRSLFPGPDDDEDEANDQSSTEVWYDMG